MANMMEDKANNTMNGGTGTTWMLSFIGKKLSKRKRHRGKISPSSSRMRRTISIHHLECTDFVPQSEVGQMALDSESSKIALSSDSLAMNEQESLVLKAIDESAEGKPGEACGGIDAADDLPGSNNKLDKIENHLLDEHIVLKGKLVEARDALLKLKDTNPKGMENEFSIRSKNFLDTLELFNANREALIDTPEDLNYISSDYPKRLQAPAEARVLTKSVSFPGLEFPGKAAGILLPSHKRLERDLFVTQGTKSDSVSSFINTVGVGSDSEGLPGSYELRKRREAGTVLNRWKDLKLRINDAIMENGKEKHRISRDGILHKVPFGRKLQHDKKMNLWDDPASESCDIGGEGSKLNNAQHGSYRKFARKSIQRSRSLTESLDRYSKLLETLSLNEKGEAPESSKSIQEDSGLRQGKLPKNLGRMFSNPVFRSYSFSKVVQSEVHLESSKLLAPEPFGSEMEKTVRSNSIQEDSGLQQGKLPKNLGRMWSSPVFRSYSFSKVVQSEPYLEQSKILTSEPLGIAMEKDVDKPNTDAITSPILEKGDCEHEVVVEPDNPLIAEEVIRSDKFVMPTVESINEMIESQVNPVSMDDCEHIEPSLITEVLDEKADLVNEAQREAESDVKLGKPSFISSLDLNMVEGPASSSKYLLPEADSELKPMRIDSEDQHQLSDAQNIDQKDDTVFEFVRDVLRKPGNGVLLSSYELGTESELYDTPFVQQLLYDLINEVLLDIYENSTAPNPWLLHFHPKIRAMPAGNYLLKAVCAEISWHFCSPQGLNATLDDLIGHKFAKSDGWMNVYRDAECVALQLELLILNDLLDEAVVDSDEFDF